MHIAPHDNRNLPIVDADHPLVPLNYYNIVKLKRGEAFDYAVPGYETCVVPETGTVTVETSGMVFATIGNRGVDVWDGEPVGVYVSSGAETRISCDREAAEVFVGGLSQRRLVQYFQPAHADQLHTIPRILDMVAKFK